VSEKHLTSQGFLSSVGSAIFGTSGFFRYPGVHYAVTPNFLSLQSPKSKISVSLLSGPTTQLSPLKPVTVLQSPMALGLRDFGTSGFRYPGVHYAVTSNSLSLQSPKSKIRFTLFSGPTTQLSPLTTVARGTFRRIHVSIGDVFGSHRSRLSFQFSGTWYTSMHPRPFQAKIQRLGPLSDLRRRSFRRFGVSGIGSPCIPYLELPFAEIPKLRFTRQLDPTVNSLPTIYGVDRFGISGFGFRRCSPPSLPISRLCEIRKVFATNSSATPPDLTVEPSSQIYNVDLLGFSGVRVSRFPRSCATPKGF
jgi:hypothetical protein